jgi:hypothetical protein
VKITEQNFKIAVGLIGKGINNLSFPRLFSKASGCKTLFTEHDVRTTFLTEHGVLYEVIYLPKWIHDNIEHAYIIRDPQVAEKALHIAIRYRMVDLDKGQFNAHWSK